MKNLIILKGKKVIFSFIAVFLVTSAALAEDSIIKIGVLAKRGPERCLEKWSPTAEYLNNKIPEKTFVIVPVDFDQIYSVVEKSEVDFILVNSSLYVEMESRYGINRIATLKNKVLAGIYTKYGGAVFCKKQREDIRQYSDLKGKTFMAVEKTSFGGWRMAWRELKEAGIDPFKDFASMSFGGTHDAVIYAVRDGKVDAGTVRTDTLERMNKEGKISIDDFRVIHEHGGGNVHLPFLHSTREYPEWPIAKLKHTSNEVAEKVAVALIGMPEASAAAQAARCAGWTIPLNYQSVHDCLKELKVGPYKGLGKITLTDVFKKYWILILIDLATIVVLAWFLATHIILNRKIKTAHKQLESEVKERIQTEELFRKERDKVLAYLDIAGVIIVVLNNDQSVAVINKKGCEILCYDESEIIGKKWLDNFLPEKDRDQTRAVFSELLAGNIEPVKYYENYILTKDNKERLIAWNNSVIRDDEGKIIATLSSGEDITERKQIEAKLQLKNLVFEMSITANSIADTKGILTQANNAFIRTWGYENMEEVIGKPINEFLKFEDEAKKIITALDEAGEWKGEYTALKKDGTTFVAHALATIIKDASGMIVGYQSAVLDISEQKQAEKTLLESKERYRSLFERSLELVYICDFEGNFIEANDAALEGLGYTKKDMKSLNFMSLLGKDQLPRAFEAVEEILKTGSQKEVVEYKLKRKDGEHIYVESKGALIYRDGKPFAIQGIARNITERKLAEEALRESEEKYRSMMNAMKDPVYICSSDYRVEYMNPVMIRSLGRDATGEKCFKAIHDLDEICTWCMHSKISRNEFFEYDIVSPRNNRHYRITNSAIVHKDGSFSKMTVFRDTTDYIKIKEQLQQAQKMEAIGTLAGGVAHDFNNLLTTIIGNAQLALNDISKDDSLRNQIEEIVKAGQRSAALTRQLLAFSRKQIIQPRVLDLNEVLNGIEKMLGRLIAEDIELLLILEPALWQVEADPGQIEQVIMNLTVNARDAMPIGGKLTIETANANLDENYFREHGIDESPDSYVMMAISDTGSGMDKETQEHIFEPFYTTKEIGKGTGLGLSTVYGIVKQNNGFIWIYSEPGQGSTFKIYLPKTKGDVEAKKKERIPEGDLNGSETVLIVEDDDSLRKLAQKALQMYGYKVMEAENGEDALRVSEEYEGQIDLMVTDVVMPKMSGRETAERLQPLYPKMKVIYMSGYTDNAIAHHGVLTPGLNFLEKPFAPGALARKVREVLDE